MEPGTSPLQADSPGLADPRELFDLSGRVALVTGATRGLGLAIATAYAGAGAEVVVVSRKTQACADVAAEINEQHTNTRYLGERVLNPELAATADLEEALAAADALVVGVPSHGIRAVLADAAPHIRPWVPVLSLAKGLEPDTKLRPTQVIGEVLEGHPVGLLAGPNLAREILDGFAAAAVVAMRDESVACSLQPLFHSPRFRVYRNQDRDWEEHPEIGAAGVKQPALFIGGRRDPAVLFGKTSPATRSQERRTWICRSSRSTSLQRSAWSSPRRSPA